MDAEATGFAALILGAGRETKESQIDLSAGILLNKKVGDSVDAGETIATFYSSSQEKINEAKDKFLQAITINDQPVKPTKLIKAIVTKDGIQDL
jgi:pyrimidine-nucleoside phosphorylase